MATSARQARIASAPCRGSTFVEDGRVVGEQGAGGRRGHGRRRGRSTCGWRRGRAEQAYRRPRGKSAAVVVWASAAGGSILSAWHRSSRSATSRGGLAPDGEDPAPLSRRRSAQASDVDPRPAIAYYSVEQIPLAQVIRRLRNLRMPVAEVQDVLAAPDADARNRLIAEHLARLESELAETRTAVSELRDLLQPPAPPRSSTGRSRRPPRSPFSRRSSGRTSTPGGRAPSASSPRRRSRTGCAGPGRSAACTRTSSSTTGAARPRCTCRATARSRRSAESRR